MSELKNSRGEVIKAIPGSTLDFNVLVDVLDWEPIPESGIIVPESQIYKVDKVGIVEAASAKKQEKDVFNMYEATKEHPFQAIVIQTNKEMEKKGLKVGTIVYCGIGLFLARSVVQINGFQYPLIGSSQVLSIVGHVSLEETSINSKNLK